MTTCASRSRDEIVRANCDRMALYYDQCRSASYRLADDLRSHGYDAEVLRCMGLRTPAPDADRRWHALGAQRYWVHYVVILGPQIVDLTRRQFFPTCENPFYQSAEAFEAEWDGFAPDVQNPRFRKADQPENH